MRITLVRHGEIADPAPGIEMTGHDDPELTQHGRRQAAALASELFEALDRGTTYSGVYTSPLKAARLTAEAIAAVTDTGDPVVVPELITLTPEVLPAGGDTEALEMLQSRAWEWIEALRQDLEQTDHIIAITHELTIRTLVCRALSLPLSEMRRFEIEPGSMTTIEFRLQNQRERILIASLNETCHLEQSIAP